MLTFIDELPPRPYRGNSFVRPAVNWDAVAAELRANPGRWAEVRRVEGAQTGAATSIRRALALRGEFALTQRYLRDEDHTVFYARAEK